MFPEQTSFAPPGLRALNTNVPTAYAVGYSLAAPPGLKTGGARSARYMSPRFIKSFPYNKVLRLHPPTINRQLFVASTGTCLLRSTQSMMSSRISSPERWTTGAPLYIV